MSQRRGRSPWRAGTPVGRLSFALSPAWTIALVAALLALAPAIVSSYYASDVLAKAMILALLAVALDLAWGYGGILSLGHAAFFGTGAYAMAIILLRWDSTAATLAGLLVAVLAPALLAAVVGWLVFYGATSTLYVAIVTLSLPLLLSAIDLRIPELTGGLTGLSGIPLFPWSGNLTTYYVLLGVLLAATALVYRIVRSDFGRLLVAARDNDQRARFLGYDVPAVRLIAFTLSAALAGFAGALYAPYNGFVSYDLLGLALSTSAIVWVAIGGRGTLAGPLIGALVVNVLEPSLNAAFPGFWQLLLGLIFIVVILVFPSGIYGLLAGARAEDGRMRVIDAPARPPGAARPDLAVNARGLRLAFGSLTVLRNLDLTVNSGVLHCLIGPNGAGKSTLVNVITGLLRPGAGEIRLNEALLPPAAPAFVARRGVMRTFQASSVFETLSVGDNLFLACGSGIMPSLVRSTRFVSLPPQAANVLALAGLDGRLEARAGDLGHGERKWLELCMVLAADPVIVFLDEPTAGLSAPDRSKAGAVLVELVREHRLGLLLIEHDLEFVKAIADRITVLNSGEIVADGTVAAVAASRLVQQIYLGAPAAAASRAAR